MIFDQQQIYNKQRNENVNMEKIFGITQDSKAIKSVKKLLSDDFLNDNIITYLLMM